jgi:hypothetical protein
MNSRLHSTKVISREKIYETFITPGYYIVLTLGFLLSYFLINGFVHSIDSSGFDFTLSPLYSSLGKTISGAFGDTMMENLFTEGPFLFTFFIYLVPVLFFISFSSVFNFGLEKKVGALELVSYGPSDGTSYFLAVFARDILFAVVSILLFLLFAVAAAGTNNLVLGPRFLLSLLAGVFFSLVVFAYGILANGITDNGGSAVILFLGILLLFAVLFFGSLSLAGGYVQSLFNTFSWVLQWFSPFYYLGLCMRAVETGNVPLYLLGVLISLVLSGGLLAVSHIVFKNRGVRP